MMSSEVAPYNNMDCHESLCFKKIEHKGSFRVKVEL